MSVDAAGTPAGITHLEHIARPMDMMTIRCDLVDCRNAHKRCCGILRMGTFHNAGVQYRRAVMCQRKARSDIRPAGK